MSGPAAVEARGLVKRYGDVTAVDGIDLTVAEGDVYGYLGPNGAGKTTSLRMLLGLIRPDAGRVRLLGRDPAVDGARALDGVAGFVEAPRFYPYLSGRRNLELVAALDGARGGGADRVGAAHRRPGRSRAAQGPRLLARHAPTPRARRRAAPRSAAAGARLAHHRPGPGRHARHAPPRPPACRRGDDRPALVHQMAEVEELCDRVAVVRDGRIAYHGSLGALKASAANGFALRTTDDVRARRVALVQPGVEGVEASEGGLRVRAGENAVAALSIALAEAGVGIHALVPRGLRSRTCSSS